MKKKTKWIVSLIILLFLLFVFAIKVTPSTEASSTEKLKVHFIDVGQADCILIQTPSNHTMLIDAGNDDDSDKILSYIKKLNIKKIDVIIGTHPHEDHIGGLHSIISGFEIGKIYIPKVSSNTKTFEKLLNTIKSKSIKVTTATAGLKISLDSKLAVNILAPNGVKYDDVNNYSAVVKLVFGNTSFLFTGDAEEVSENEMLAKKYILKADVLKEGHHGSNSSTSINFLNAVSPKFAVISVGKNNDYGHPADETISKLVNAKIKIFRTDLSGTIIATSDGRTITFEEKASAINSQSTPSNIETIVPNTSYIGNKNSLKFHLPSCSSLPLSQNRINFKTREAAITAGYFPCKICNP